MFLFINWLTHFSVINSTPTFTQETPISVPLTVSCTLAALALIKEWVTGWAEQMAKTSWIHRLLLNTRLHRMWNVLYCFGKFLLLSLFWFPNIFEIGCFYCLNTLLGTLGLRACVGGHSAPSTEFWFCWLNLVTSPFHSLPIDGYKVVPPQL